MTEQTAHALNEWADFSSNALQWLRNIKDDISTPDEALAEMTENYRRVIALSRDAVSEPEVSAMEIDRIVIDALKPDAEPNTRKVSESTPTAGLGEPVAWVYPRRWGSGVGFVKPTNCTDEDGNPIEPTPLYAAPTVAPPAPLKSARKTDE